MPEDFQALLMEGVFHLDDSGSRLLSDGRDVYAGLLPLVGRRIQFAAHHVPDSPPNPARWGGGCCRWEPAECPFGHRQNPARLFVINGEGVLGHDLPHGWFLEQFDGTRLALPLVEALQGHDARVLAATQMSVEKMRDIVTASGVEALGTKAADLAAMLGRLRGSV